MALGQLQLMRQLAADGDPCRAGRALGMVQTTWTFLDKFARSYSQADAGKGAAQVACFKTLFAELRRGGGT